MTLGDSFRYILTARHGRAEFALAQPLFFILLDRIDWLAVGLVVFILGGLLLAFFLYFRTAFKAGGWGNVKRSAWIALGALTLFVIERILQNHALGSLKKFLEDLLR